MKGNGKGFYTFHQKKRVFLFKLAVSQDGMLAPDRQKLAYLSSTASLNEVQRLPTESSNYRWC